VRDGLGVGWVDVGAQHGQRHHPVHSAGVQVARAERLRQSL
jgi:hypothetical protein